MDVYLKSMAQNNQDHKLKKTAWGYHGSFRAMASPCELLMATNDAAQANKMLQFAYSEAVRIEQKYSRFIQHNPLWKINNSQGNKIAIDSETYALLGFAKQCHQLSEGEFDISAGPIMKLWRFDGSSHTPNNNDILHAISHVGFSKVDFTESHLRMPKGMSLDFGGIAKEYAVDKVANQLASDFFDISVLINFGGDIACPIAHAQRSWKVAIENPQKLDNAATILNIRQGALATSGDSRRFIEKNGSRYGHIINPQTGYPVENAPRSVTVLSSSCITCGMLTTMAMLQGDNAEQFLEAQNVKFKIFR